MAVVAKNPNRHRRPLPGLLARCAAPVLNPLLLCLRRKSNNDGVLTVFSSYMVGDFFMALPALKSLTTTLKKSAAREDRAPVQILCRPDCIDLLAREGLTGIAFANPFFVRAGLGSFVRTWRSAWALRGRLGSVALDLDADPRTAFWLKVAGVRKVISYRRDYGVLFDETFELSEPSIHQVDKNMRVVEAWLKASVGSWGLGVGSVPDNQAGTGFESKATTSLDLSSLLTLNPQPPTFPVAWIISLWTRKAEKNWPLQDWKRLLEKLSANGVPFVILDPPDGDTGYLEFRRRWTGRTNFLRGTLPQIADAVRNSAGVIATDNFLGHMAGYYGKPVLWINLCSPAEQVAPRGPRTIAATNPTVEEVRRAFKELQD